MNVVVHDEKELGRAISDNAIEIEFATRNENGHNNK